MTDKLDDKIKTAKDAAFEIELVFESYLETVDDDYTIGEEAWTRTEQIISVLLTRAVEAERERCVARAAAALERTNLNPPQRLRVLAAIREGES